MGDFIKENWVDICLIFVGSLALIIYWIQERRKKIEAAALIVSQIDELQEGIKQLSSCIVDGKLNESAFYEMIPLMDENYWSKYKHFFVRNMDGKSYRTIDELYKCTFVLQEQQMLMKNLQKNFFFIIQNVMANYESQLIMQTQSSAKFNSVTVDDVLSAFNSTVLSNMDETTKLTLENIINQVFQNNQTLDLNGFWKNYRQKQEIIKTIINQNPLTEYIPVQIRISIEKILTQYSLLEISGCDGYRLLKKTSQKLL